MILYILTTNCGDGSNSINFVLDSHVIHRLQVLADNDTMDSENGWGVDGDGFSYTEIEVPDGSTYKSLKISKWSMITNEDVDEKFGEEEEI